MTASGENKPWPQQILFFPFASLGATLLCVSTVLTHMLHVGFLPALTLVGLVNYSAPGIRDEMASHVLRREGGRWFRRIRQLDELAPDSETAHFNHNRSSREVLVALLLCSSKTKTRLTTGKHHLSPSSRF